MFDLELNIGSWCDYLRSSGKLNETDVMELENHLREQIDELIENGLSEDEAFLVSVKRLGNLNSISKEYSKVNTDDLWKQLLVDPVASDAKKQNQRDVFMVILFSLLAGTVAKIPAVFGIPVESHVYLKNLGFYIIPFIALFFAAKHNIDKKLMWYITGIFALTGAIVNLYPSYSPNHTGLLTGIHLPMFLWLIAGVAYLGKEWKTSKGRMNFIRFSGESVIYGSLIMLGLMVLMMFIVMIFEAVSIDVERFIENYFLIYGGCAAAMVTVYLVETKKSVVENFAPILAKIFSPLFLITMVVFLLTIALTGNSPFAERDFLIGFDLMLVLVLGMVLYTISARSIYDKRNVFDYLNVALISVAILVDAVALSAIIVRLSAYGISPNKLAALGENILLLVNLAALLCLYVRYFMGKIEFKKIEAWQTGYLTGYGIWMAIVVFVFPLVFRFH